MHERVNAATWLSNWGRPRSLGQETSHCTHEFDVEILQTAAWFDVYHVHIFIASNNGDNQRTNYSHKPTRVHPGQRHVDKCHASQSQRWEWRKLRNWVKGHHNLWTLTPETGTGMAWFPEKRCFQNIGCWRKFLTNNFTHRCKCGWSCGQKTSLNTREHCKLFYVLISHCKTLQNAVYCSRTGELSLSCLFGMCRLVTVSLCRLEFTKINNVTAETNVPFQDSLYALNNG